MASDVPYPCSESTGPFGWHENGCTILDSWFNTVADGHISKLHTGVSIAGDHQNDHFTGFLPTRQDQNMRVDLDTLYQFQSRIATRPIWLPWDSWLLPSLGTMEYRLLCQHLSSEIDWSGLISKSVLQIRSGVGARAALSNRKPNKGSREGLYLRREDRNTGSIKD